MKKETAFTLKSLVKRLEIAISFGMGAIAYGSGFVEKGMRCVIRKYWIPLFLEEIAQLEGLPTKAAKQKAIPAAAQSPRYVKSQRQLKTIEKEIARLQRAAARVQAQLAQELETTVANEVPVKPTVPFSVAIV